MIRKPIPSVRTSYAEIIPRNLEAMGKKTNKDSKIFLFLILMFDIVVSIEYHVSITAETNLPEQT